MSKKELKTTTSGYGIYVDLTQKAMTSPYYRMSKEEIEKGVALGQLQIRYKALLDTGMLVEDAINNIKSDPLLSDCGGDVKLIENKLDSGFLVDDVYKWNYELDLLFDLRVKENATFIKELEKQLQETFVSLEENKGKKFKPDSGGKNTPLVYFSKCAENSQTKFIEGKFGNADDFARVRFKNQNAPAFLIRSEGLSTDDFQDDYSKAYSGAKYIVKYDLTCSGKRSKVAGNITAYMHTVLLDEENENWSSSASPYSKDELAFG